MNTSGTPADAASTDPGIDPALTARIRPVVEQLRTSFDQGLTRPLEARLDQLAALRRGVERMRPEITAALAEDLGKSAAEAETTEIGPVLHEIDHVRRNLATWLRPRRVGLGLALTPGTAQLHREPLGLVLVIAPWNYPVNLSLSPLIGAIAGGNTAILKPSEVAPATSAVLEGLVAEHLDPAWVQVIEGAVPETTALLAERFDLIFYTGNGTVGRIVARAAAEHLTPTVLELGGKSPVYIDETVDPATAARRIVWGKFTNAGQTCVAPDYLMAPAEVIEDLVPHLRRAVHEMYGADPHRSRDYGRIVNARHHERLMGLFEGTTAVLGGPDSADADDLYIPPSLLQDVDWDSPVMQEEIFGPLLPLLPVRDSAEAVARIRAGEKPLTAYVFSEDENVQRQFVEETSSGSLAIGLTVAHLGAVTMPFGGVGESGHGAYHGEHSLRVFTHEKPVVRKPLRPDTLRMVYPPVGALKRTLLRRLLG
ncbi:aldehyde dehydrogenase family protein [Brachybacterium sp. EF45031]|uniref:aldehyde dehydrogenase family protein n=1 Tax=Brachybacterium sillae TaxID=2810536 RepID=UPI00217DF9C9|nr:aldehyde dehydrogenase family protein [Brachybacterium sillae]MCS6711610.1 aldehyde dehydrogenase family protein [Brachybacterium sillae]